MRFNFGKGETETTLVATGMHCRSGRYREYNITGRWNFPSEDGKIPVKLKITYGTSYDFDTEMEGAFDPEESTLRGTFALKSFGSTGEFVFKRHPDLVRFYSAPSTMTARKRWGFATASVLDRIRQEAWSPTRILERMKDGKRFMELILRQYYGNLPSGQDRMELRALFSELYEADIRFYGSLVIIQLDDTLVFE